MLKNLPVNSGAGFVQKNVYFRAGGKTNEVPYLQKSRGEGAQK
jgi:hypothetical protein